MDLLPVPQAASRIIEAAAKIYIKHAADHFAGLIVHGSALKGGIIPGCSDIDFKLYLQDEIFNKDGMLPLEMVLALQRDLAGISIEPFGYIQCDSLSVLQPKLRVGPVPGAYRLLAGRLPVAEATNEQLHRQAHEALGSVAAVPKYLNTLLDHGRERLTRIIRLLCTEISPLMYHAVTVMHADALQIWRLPKQEVIELLPNKEIKQHAVYFYEEALRYYPSQTSTDSALEMIRHGVSFLESLKSWAGKIQRR
ncbi:hypothetical protein [Paenibacillus tengchongensis]|uniref:hypothetical protein n=1 Tax=Paenibacillus tengchongensis TaxID=2608684 RepID=UPI00124EC509|nr:hypothetical protein [Paenibacillus tengchongensis]